MESLVTNKKDKVLEHFLINPTSEFHLRELSRKVKVSFPWVRKVVSELAKENLLIRKTEHGLVLVSANREHSMFRAVKRSYNLLALAKSGLMEKLVEEYQRPEAIVLFGSYSRGEDTEGSDIDLAVLTRKTIVADVSAFAKILRRKINIHELQKEKIEKEFWNSLANGIVLHGFLEVR